jgi:hypothetical protein
VPLVANRILDDRSNPSKGIFDFLEEDGVSMTSLSGVMMSAAEPGRRLEELAGKLAIAALVAGMFPERYHSQSRNCLFDGERKGVLLGESAHAIRFCEACTGAIASDPVVRTLRAIAGTLEQFGRTTG